MIFRPSPISRCALWLLSVSRSQLQVWRKRLISMPSRCEDDIGDVAKWWLLWKRFMFRTPLGSPSPARSPPPAAAAAAAPDGDKAAASPPASTASSASLAPTVGDASSAEGEGGSATVLGLLEPIPRSKYPALSPAEEAVSLPYQVPRRAAAAQRARDLASSAPGGQGSLLCQRFSGRQLAADSESSYPPSRPRRTACAGAWGGSARLGGAAWVRGNTARRRRAPGAEREGPR